MTLVGTKVGKIRLTERLGAGGMGEVYIGFDERLERQVAVKAIRGKLRMDPAAKARFVREAKVLSQLEHPNICRVYDFIEGDACDFLILELIKGSVLDAEVCGKLNRSEKLQVAQQIAGVLAAAHAKDIVHRDLKPENVMRTQDGRVKVLDFGLARGINPQEVEEVIEDRAEEAASPAEAAKTIEMVAAPKGSTDAFQTRRGVIMGTPMFMSPEQARGERITAASDMYSFGLLLQWLFTGKSPYPEGITSTGLLISAMRGKTLSVDGLDPDLMQLMARLKSTIPETRPTALDTLDRLTWISEKPKRRFKTRIFAAFAALLLAGVSISSIGFYRAKRSEREAVLARDRAQVVSRFLQDLLASANPRERGKDVKVLEILDWAQDTIDDDFSNHPINRAAVYQTLGTTYSCLGELDKAHACLTESADIWTQELGADHVDTLASMAELGTVLEEQGRLAEAETLLRDVLARSKKALGPDHPQTLVAMDKMARVLSALGKYDEAGAVSRNALNLRLEAFPDDDRSIISCRGILAGIVDAQGRLDEAERIHRRVVEDCNRVLGAEHPDTVNATNNLAMVLEKKGKKVESEALFRRVLDISTRKLGQEHPHTLALSHNLAVVLKNHGNLPEAEALANKTMHLQRKVLGENHPATINSLAILAVIKHDQGEIDRAIEIQSEVVSRVKKALGNTHPSSLLAMYTLATFLAERGKIPEAEQAYREAVACHTQGLGADHPHTVICAANLAKILTVQGKREEAEKLWRDVVPRSEAALGPTNHNTLVAKVFLAGILEEKGQVNAAVSRYQEAAELGSEDAMNALKRLGIPMEDARDEGRAEERNAPADEM